MGLDKWAICEGCGRIERAGHVSDAGSIFPSRCTGWSATGWSPILRRVAVFCPSCTKGKVGGVGVSARKWPRQKATLTVGEGR
jgi:hypothetical protein